MSREKPNLIQQLMQRRVMRAMSLYLVSAFVILQVADITFEPLGLPAWVLQGLIAALVAGLPATAVLAWIFDLTRSGIVRTGDEATAQQAPAFTTARKVEAVLIVALCIALAWFMYVQMSTESGGGVLTMNRSVAVMPFSSFGGEEHLALGLTNELTSALSIIPDLHVASYSFAAIGRLASDTEVARALNVEHLVKGSVQQANEQLRVTAQVLRARDGKVLWSLKQDQPLTDIFAIQDEIATNVAINLRSTLYREALAASAATRTDNLLWYAHLGNEAKAREWLVHAVDYAKQTDSTATIGILAAVMHRLGHPQQAAAYLAQLEEQQRREYVSPAGLFWAYFGTGDLDRAFIALNRAVDENVLILLMELKTSPLLDELRNDLRFISVLDRLGLNGTQGI